MTSTPASGDRPSPDALSPEQQCGALCVATAPRRVHGIGFGGGARPEPLPSPGGCMGSAIRELRHGLGGWLRPSGAQPGTGARAAGAGRWGQRCPLAAGHRQGKGIGRPSPPVLLHPRPARPSWADGRQRWANPRSCGLCQGHFGAVRRPSAVVCQPTALGSCMATDSPGQLYVNRQPSAVVCQPTALGSCMPTDNPRQLYVNRQPSAVVCQPTALGSCMSTGSPRQLYVNPQPSAVVCQPTALDSRMSTDNPRQLYVNRQPSAVVCQPAALGSCMSTDNPRQLYVNRQPSAVVAQPTCHGSRCSTDGRSLLPFSQPPNRVGVTAFLCLQPPWASVPFRPTLQDCLTNFQVQEGRGVGQGQQNALTPL